MAQKPQPKTEESDVKQFNLNKEEMATLIFIVNTEQHLSLEAQALDMEKYKLNEQIKKRIGAIDTKEYAFKLKIVDMYEGKISVERVKIEAPKEEKKVEGLD